MLIGEIQTVENESGATVYHVEELIEGQAILQEFRTIKQAQDYIAYVKEIEG